MSAPAVPSTPAPTPTAADGTHYLVAERALLERYLPGYATELWEAPLLELEDAGSETIRRFREAGGPPLLVPAERGGLGASAVEAVRFQRAIGRCSPSLAAATTMHHFSFATLVEFAEQEGETAWLLVEGLAREKMLLASGFAEGRTGQGILAPTMRAVRTDDGWSVTGKKKPCSLSASMDLLTASVQVEVPGAEPERGVALIPAQAPGIEVRPFWGSWILRGAESDEVILTDVPVPEELVMKSSEADPEGHHDDRGFVWFELLIAASYVGAVSNLVERVIRSGKGDPVSRAQLATETEGAMSALEGVAFAMQTGVAPNDLLARSLFVRYSVQQSVARAATAAIEMLGGMAFVRSSEVGYLAGACQALAFHPPGRAAASGPLDQYLSGAPLKLA